MAAVRLEGVAKIFPGGTVAVAGVDLDVGEREMVVLLGPSGCGKSTLLRIIAGIESPTQGRVFLDGRDVTDLPPQRRDIAMVFQSYALYPHMNVRENLAFGLKMRGTRGAEARERVGKVAASLGIEELLDRRPAQLSGGQRQRVALGRAIARRARVFLLDEPLSNLDLQLRVTTRMELARLHRSLQVPMIYVTHDQEEAMTLGDRVVVMREGHVLQIDSPIEIYRRPATQFVAGFVGAPRMNFFHGRLAASGGQGARFEAPGLGLELDLPLPASCSSAIRHEEDRKGTGAWLGIRPEDLRLVDPSQGKLRGRVDLVEPLGREALVHVTLGEDRESGGTEARLLAGSDSVPNLGRQVGLDFAPGRVHLFDGASGARVG